MALTKVGPAGIGSTPGTGYVIGDSFLHSTGLNATNAYYTGIVTAQTFRVLGNFQVDGTTTTLDTEVTSVDKLEVEANNTTVGVAITQSGSGDILNLYDSSTEVFSVADGGAVTTSGDISVGGDLTLPDAIVHSGDTDTKIRFPATDTVTVETAGSERVRVTSGGSVGIGTNSPQRKLEVFDGDIYLNSTDKKIFLTSDHDQYITANAASNYLVIGTANQERLRITSGGNVGIGTDSPGELLHLTTTSGNGKIRIDAASAASIDFYNSGTRLSDIFTDASTSNLTITNRQNADIIVRTNGTNERLRITSAGKVGIGTGIPDYSLTIGDGSSYVIQNLKSKNDEFGEFRFGDPEGVAQGKISYDHNTDSLRFTTNGDGEKLRITSDGKMCIGSASDEDLQFGTDANAILQLSTASAPKLILCRDDTSITTNDYLGIIDFHSRDGGIKRVARIGARAGGNHGADDGPTDLVFHTMGDNTATTAEERLRITYDGKVGINDTAPSEKLNVGGNIMLEGDNQFMYLCDQGTGNAGIYVRGYCSGSTSNHFLRSHSTNMFTWEVTGQEKMRLDSGGSLSIGSRAAMSPAGNPTASGARLSIDCQGRNVFSDATNVTKYGLAFHNDPTTDHANGIGFFNDDGSTCGGYIVHQDKGGSNSGDFVFGTTSTSSTNNPIERLRIAHDGKVGIGTDNPETKLHVKDGMVLAGVEDTVNSDFYGLLGYRALGSGLGGYGIDFRSGYENPIIWGYSNASHQDGAIRFSSMEGGNRTLGSGLTDRMVIKMYTGKVGIGTDNPTALLDIDHPHTERGLLVRCRYGNIASAMVKFDADPLLNNGDGNVLHIHGGNSRTDSEILQVDSTGCGDIFQIRGDGLIKQTLTKNNFTESHWYNHTANGYKIEYDNNDVLTITKQENSNGYDTIVYRRIQMSKNCDIEFDLHGNAPSGSSYRHVGFIINGDGGNTSSNFDRLVFRYLPSNNSNNQIRIDKGGGGTGFNHQNSNIPNFFDGTYRHILIQIRDRVFRIYSDGVLVNSYRSDADLVRGKGWFGLTIYEQSSNGNPNISLKNFSIRNEFIKPNFLVKATGVNVDIAGGSKFPFNSRIHDPGDDYDTSNYYFTAPVHGLYYLFFNIYRNSSTGTVVSLYVNSSETIQCRPHPQTGDYIFSSSGLLNLNKGDQVSIRAENTFDNFYGNNEQRRSTFGGYLVD